MSFSDEWDEIYKNNFQIAIWPWSDCVTYFMRYIKPEKGIKVLELGFGSGANIPFFKKIGADLYGIEGSKTIVEAVKLKYPEYAKNLICGDFTKEIPFNVEFDVVVDRSAITFNVNSEIEKIADNVYKKLKPNGYFIGIDWFSTMHSELKRECEKIDENSYIFKEGYWKNSGIVHLSNEKYLKKLLNKFQIKKLEHKNSTCFEEDKDKFETDTNIKTLAAWNFIAKKVNYDE